MSSTKPTEGACWLSPRDKVALAQLFENFEATAPHFRPHPLTAEEAHRICCYVGNDLYMGYYEPRMVGEDTTFDLVGYGMLRWTQGFEHPSLGIGVHGDHRGTGVGRKLMAALHTMAGHREIAKIRLRVSPDNVRAKVFYERLGYVFTGQVDRGELVGWCDLVAKDDSTQEKTT